MNRRYTTNDYRQALSLIRGMVPEAAITTDIIVGFPGETEEEFEQSYSFCHEMEFARKVSDEIIFIDQGLVVERSAPEQFFASDNSARLNQFLGKSRAW